MANDTAVKPAARKRATPAKKATAKRTAKKTASAGSPPAPPPGWYPDPAQPEVERYWDGGGWDTRRGSKRPGDPEPDPVVEEADPAVAEGVGGAPVPAGTITFRGRVMAFRKPNADQLAVWKMIAERAQRNAREFETPKPCPDCQGTGCDQCQGTGSAHTATIFKLFDRAMAIISSVLIDEADKDWLEDELIAGRVNLQAASEIVNLTVAAMIASRGSAAPRNGPVLKARRRR